MQANNSKVVYRIFIFLSINILLLILLYNLPLETGRSLCLHKAITGKECFNCGMTRAFLSIIHLQFEQAYAYNWRVVFVFPYTVLLYLYVWSEFIFGKKWIKKFLAKKMIKFDKKCKK